MNKVPVYWRKLIVRAIEDSVVLVGLFVGMWLIGAGATLGLRWLTTLFA